MIAMIQSNRSGRRPSEIELRFDDDSAGYSGARELAASEVVDQLRSQDLQAFEALIHRSTPRLLAVAKRFLRNAEDAADVVQDTFIVAWLGLPRFRGQSSVETWLHRILVNACLMKLRSAEALRNTPPARLAESAAHIADHRAGPADPAWGNGPDGEELRGVVRSCIDRLLPEQREIILLRDIERFDTAQTAQLLGLTPGAVKTRLHRAHQALRVLLEAEPGYASRLPAINGNRHSAAASKPA
jgi:RNA polymerase sigma-70 factor, ECF subfamily